MLSKSTKIIQFNIYLVHHLHLFWFGSLPCFILGILYKFESEFVTLYFIYNKYKIIFPCIMLVSIMWYILRVVIFHTPSSCCLK